MMGEPETDDDLGRFMARVQIEDNGCWTWLAGFSSARVPSFYCKGRAVSAARWIYEHRHGPQPPHRTARRTCGSTACVNPSHRRIGPDHTRKNRLGPHLQTIPPECRKRAKRGSVAYRMELEREAYRRKKERLGASCQVCGAKCSERDRTYCKSCSPWGGVAHRRGTAEYLRHQHEAWKARREFAAKRRRSAS